MLHCAKLFMNKNMYKSAYFIPGLRIRFRPYLVGEMRFDPDSIFKMRSDPDTYWLEKSPTNG